MNKLSTLNFINKVRKSTSKDVRQLLKELDSMLVNKIIYEKDYAYLLGFLYGVIDTKIDYNIVEK